MYRWIYKNLVRDILNKVKDRSSSLETKFNLQSDNMGIVSMAYNAEKHLLATNSINGDICFFSTETGILLH